MSLRTLKRCYDGLCGAEDCPKCNPGCDAVVTCSECGKEEYICYIDDDWEMDSFNIYCGLCPECVEKLREQENEENEETDG